jgi:hypothetical protein
LEHDSAPAHPPEIPLGQQPLRGAVFAGNVPFPAMWMALACLGLGAFLVRTLVTGGFQPEPESLLEPWMLTPIAALVLLVGLVSAAFGSQEVRRALVRQRSREPHHTDLPWTWDHPWRRTGVADGSLREVSSLWLMAAAWCLLLSPFVGFAFFPGGELSLRGDDSEAVPAPVRVMIGIFAGVGALLVAGALRGLIAHLWRGPRFLRFHGFPFLLGGRLEATLETRWPVGTERLTLTLRCVAEHVVRESGSGKARDGTTIRTELEQLWATTFDVELPAGGDGRRVPIVVDLPADAPPTSLSQDPPRYWRLDVRLPDGPVRFLVPVYSAVAVR